MGYTTTFIGILKFTEELKSSELAHLNKFLGEDCRDHPEWEKNEFLDEIYYAIDLKLTDDFSGIEWNEMEKSYEMVSQVNYIISQMKKIKPDFTLEGKFSCRGEDFDDIWELIIGEDGFAKRVDLIPEGIKIQCPSCGEYFYYKDEDLDE